MKKSILVFIVVAVSVGLSMAAFVAPALAARGDVSTWLGTVKNEDGRNALAAYLDNPKGFTTDASCNLIIADTLNNTIRRIAAADNIISTIVGSGQYGNKNGAVNVAEFKAPSDVEIGSDGAYYITDTENGSVRIARAGAVSTWITGLKNPTGTVLDGTTLYISDTGNNRILKATIPSGSTTVVTNIVKPGKLAILGGYLYATGAGSTVLTKVDLATGALTSIKTGMTDLEGVAIYHDLVYFIASDKGMYNEVWTYNPATGESTKLVRVTENEWYNHASDIVFCNDQMYLLFSVGSSVYRMRTDATEPVKIAGVHRYGDQDGRQGATILGRPKAMVYSKDRKKIYLLENHRFKVFDIPTKTMTFVAGSPMDNFRDLAGTDARVSGPTQMVLSKDGKKIYFADRNNNRIRALVIAEARLETLSGAGNVNQFADTYNGYKEGAACTDTQALGVAGCAYFYRPMGIALSSDGKTLYVADTGNNRIRSINVATGRSTLLTGSGAAGLKDGIGSKAWFNAPISLTLSADGKKLYVVDQKNHAIREVDLASKRVRKIVGSGKGGYREGSFSVARLNLPDSLVLGPNNTLYLSEVGTQRIRMIDLKKKTIAMVTGSGQRGSRNGSAKVASFNNPRGLLLFNTNYLLVADQMNDLIRAVKLR